ncbi:hypothetical protein PQX77_015549 [Marasmius sp. AFHP31]|nr:hypothetical protein PQX77_015549 [Marasmius sp. AFHP31]
MSILRIPPEIWLKISDSLPRSDAAQLCLVNHQFLSLIRPLMYHHVSLYQVNRTCNPFLASDPRDTIANPIDATLSLLARDGDLAQRVSGLSLYAFSWHWMSYHKFYHFHNLAVKSLIDLDAVRNMINLRRLEISGMIFHRGAIWYEREAEEVKETSAAFCEILRGIGLEELVVHPSRDSELPDFGIGLSLEQFSGFRGLKKLEWGSHILPGLVEGLRSLLSASRTTLETLDICVDRYTSLIQSAVFTLHFPRLRSLIFQRFPPGSSNPVRMLGLSQLYINFVLSHNTLTRLDLGDWRRIENDQGFSLSKYEDNLRHCPNAFPRLEWFSGDIGSLQGMVRAGLGCLSETGSLREVVVGPIRTDQQEQIEAAIAVGGVFTSLRESRVETFRLYFGKVGLEEQTAGGDSLREENDSISSPDVVRRIVEGFKVLFPSEADVQAGTDLEREPEERFVEVCISR